MFQSLSDDNTCSPNVYTAKLIIQISHLNSVAWSRCPKTIFVNKRTFEIGINSAIIHYNDRGKGLSEVLRYFDLSGNRTVVESRKRDKDRICRMRWRSGKKRKMGGDQERNTKKN